MHLPNPIIPAPDMAQEHTRRGTKHALPTINCAITIIKLAIHTRDCQARLSQQIIPQAAEQEMRPPKMSKIKQVTAAEPAAISICISTNKGSYKMQVLITWLWCWHLSSWTRPIRTPCWAHRPPGTITDCPLSCQQMKDALSRQNIIKFQLQLREKV